MHLTLTTLKIVRAFVQDRHAQHYGYEITQQIGGVTRHRVYENLASLERAGWITGEDERVDTESKRRSGGPRRFYRITDSGFARGMAALSALQLSSIASSTVAAFG